MANLFLFILSLPVQGLVPPSENSIAVSNNDDDDNNNNNNTEGTSMHSVGFEPAIPEIENPLTYALDIAGSGIC